MLHKACTPETLADALSEAEDLCRKRGGVLTPLREKVLNLLLESKRPAKAYDLLEMLRKDGPAKPPTVYRALDFLLDMGLVHRIESLQAFAPCRHWAHEHSPAFLICNVCGSMEELDLDASFRKLAQEADSVGFKTRSTVVEGRGTCANCAS